MHTTVVHTIVFWIVFIMPYSQSYPNDTDQLCPGQVLNTKVVPKPVSRSVHFAHEFDRFCFELVGIFQTQN